MPLSEQDIRRAADEVTVSDDMRQRTAPVVARIVAEIGAAQSAALGVTFNAFDPLVVGYLVEYGGFKVSGIDDTTRRLVAENLARGVAAGEGGDRLRARVEDAFSTSAARADLIARTEVNAAANAARMMSFQQSGFVTERRWLATLDNRTRDRHVRLNGQIRPMNLPFMIDGRTAMYPGGFASAEDNANCRCTTVPVVQRLNGEAIRFDSIEQEEFDRLVDGYIAELNSAALEALIGQRRSVLRILADLDR